MRLDIRCEVPKAGIPIVPEHLKLETKSGEYYDFCWSKITFFGFEPGSLTCMEVGLEDLSLVDTEGIIIKDDSEILRICSQFNQFSDSFWKEVDYEPDYITDPTILRVSYDIRETIIIFDTPHS